MEGERTSGAGVVWALLCVALASAPSAGAQRTANSASTDYPQGEVRGTLRMDSAAKQVTSATVSLETTQGEVVDQQPVSTDGRFLFNGLGKGTYVLIATADGYEPYQQMLDLTNAGGRAYVDITLKPAGSSASPSASRFSRTDALAPGKARREWEKGTRALASRKLDEAQAHFEKAVAAYPCYARAHTDLALTLMQEGESPHAEAPLKKSIECDPDYLGAYFHLGRLLNAQQRFTESRRVLAEGVRRAPSSWSFYFVLAQADFGLKDYPNAEQEYRRAQSFGVAAPPVIHERLAAVYLKENEYSKAYAEMRAYLAEDPGAHDAAAIRTVMQQLQSAGLVHPPPAPR
ncbi:MAG: tetratricopeptide repeat protein [Terriglobia bacterium]